MIHLLNAGQVQHGSPVRQIRRGNRRPVALADTLSVLQDSAPVTIPILINDFDPEGAALTLISATAILGDVAIEPDQSITYTPPPGYTGSDTITYVIQDDQNQTHGTDVTITVSAPMLSIDKVEGNTLLVDAELGLINITIIDPVEFAGTMSFETALLAAGPVNLIAPSVTGLAELGGVLTASEGLWINDPSHAPLTQGWQWQRNGSDISGATLPTYTLGAADVAQALSVVETLSDSAGSRSASSLPIGSAFSPAGDPLLHGWWDADDAATITEFAGEVSAWADKAGGADMVQSFGVQSPLTGSRTLNGRNILDFPGGRLMESPRSFPASGNLAFHMALEIDSISNLYEAILSVEAVNDFQIDAGSSTQFDGRLNAAGIGTLTAFSGGPFSGGMILSVIFDLSGAGQAEVFLANTSRATMAYTTPIDASAALHIMANRSKNAWINGAVAEVIVTEDISSRVDYHGYLSAKWGLI